MVIKLVDRIIIGDKNEIKIIFNFEDIFKDYAEKVATSQDEW
jgi:protein-disulfide isomerase